MNSLFSRLSRLTVKIGSLFKFIEMLLLLDSESVDVESILFSSAFSSVIGSSKLSILTLRLSLNNRSSDLLIINRESHLEFSDSVTTRLSAPIRMLIR